MTRSRRNKEHLELTRMIPHKHRTLLADEEGVAICEPCDAAGRPSMKPLHEMHEPLDGDFPATCLRCHARAINKTRLRANLAG